VQIKEKDEEDQWRILPVPKPKMQRILHAAKLLRHNLNFNNARFDQSRAQFELCIARFSSRP
jgi:hypothetical protein